MTRVHNGTAPAYEFCAGEVFIVMRRSFPPLFLFINWRCTAISESLVNGQIRFREVRLIGTEGEQLGVMSSQEALAKAEEAELDLVCIAPTAKPPVCKIIDYSKYRYDMIRREKEARKKQKIVELKEIRLSPN